DDRCLEPGRGTLRRLHPPRQPVPHLELEAHADRRRDRPGPRGDRGARLPLLRRRGLVTDRGGAVAPGTGAPILVTGINRSGTTWVGRTLARAPGVGLVYEPFSPRHRPGIFRLPTPHWFTYVRDDADGRIAADFRRTLGFRYSYAAELRHLRSARDAGRMARDAATFAYRRAR